jgi:hypothetical protein
MQMLQTICWAKEQIVTRSRHTSMAAYGAVALVGTPSQPSVVYETIGWKDRTKLLMSSSVRRLGLACQVTIRK